jgi:hypothetical protein
MRPVEAEEVVRTGWWSQYDEGPTLAQIEYHGFSINDADGFIAVLDCDRVGEYAWIRVNMSDWFKVLVFDCLGANGNLSWWRNNHILGEIDYYTAVKHGVEGQGGVRAHLAFDEELKRNNKFLDFDLYPGISFDEVAGKLDSGNEFGSVVLDIPANESVDVGFVGDILGVDDRVFVPDRHGDHDRLVKDKRRVWVNGCPYYEFYPICFLCPFRPVLAGPMYVPGLWAFTGQYYSYGPSCAYTGIRYHQLLLYLDSEQLSPLWLFPSYSSASIPDVLADTCVY